MVSGVCRSEIPAGALVIRSWCGCTRSNRPTMWRVIGIMSSIVGQRYLQPLMRFHLQNFGAHLFRSVTNPSLSSRSSGHSASEESQGPKSRGEKLASSAWRAILLMSKVSYREQVEHIKSSNDSIVTACDFAAQLANN